MGRTTHTTVKEETIEKAMLLFWRKGYFNTSIDEIVIETGLNKAAIYNYFADKSGLFKACLDMYYNKITCTAISKLETQTNGLEEIKSFFRQFLNLKDTPLVNYGCLLIATASEYPLHNEKIQKLIRKFSERLRLLFLNSLKSAQESFLLKKDLNLEDVAAFLLGNTFGLMTLFRSGAPSEIIECHIKEAIHYINSLSSYADGILKIGF